MDEGKQRRSWLSIPQPLWALLILILLGAAALRIPYLAVRPMHNDEAVNAIKFGNLWEKCDYKYDPNEYHGPTLYYATFVFSKLTRAPDFVHFTENRLRALTVLFGLGLVLLLPLIADGLGGRGMLWAAVLTAVSPAFVFYSRYYIHEILLVFFTVLALGAGWRYWRTRKLGWALLAGAGLGLMQATKETFVLELAAALFALGLNRVWNRYLDASGIRVKAPRLNFWHLAAALAMWLAVAAVLFSSFFTNMGGLLDSLRAFLPYLNRAGGESPHVHAWTFYFHRLLWFHEGPGPGWTELLILVLALIGAAASFFRKPLGRANASFGRFLALYTFLLTAIYCVISYKTPWCVLGFWQGAIMLAGLGAAVLVRSIKRQTWRRASTLLLLAGLAHLGWQGVKAAIPFAADQHNPYVYAQTSPDVLNLVAKIESLAQAHPAGRKLIVKVIATEADYWPLPWYLRAFPNVGWYDKMPADPWAPVMVVSAQLHAQLDERKTHLMVHYYALRPQVLFELYVRTDLWQNYLARNPPKPD